MIWWRGLIRSSQRKRIAIFYSEFNNKVNILNRLHYYVENIFLIKGIITKQELTNLIKLITYSMNTKASFSYSASTFFISASISSGVRVTPGGGGDGARYWTWYLVCWSCLGSCTGNRENLLRTSQWTGLEVYVIYS